MCTGSLKFLHHTCLKIVSDSLCTLMHICTSSCKQTEGLTAALAVTVWPDKDVHAYEGQQRPLQFGTGSVEQRTKGGGIPHVELVGVSREDVTDAQKSLTRRDEGKLERSGEREPWASCSSYLLPHAVVRVGEEVMTSLAEETQLQSLGYSFLLKTHTNTHFTHTFSRTSFQSGAVRLMSPNLCHQGNYFHNPLIHRFILWLSDTFYDYKVPEICSKSIKSSHSLWWHVKMSCLIQPRVTADKENQKIFLEQRIFLL